MDTFPDLLYIEWSMPKSYWYLCYFLNWTAKVLPKNFKRNKASIAMFCEMNLKCLFQYQIYSYLIYVKYMRLISLIGFVDSHEISSTCERKFRVVLVLRNDSCVDLGINLILTDSFVLHNNSDRRISILCAFLITEWKMTNLLFDALRQLATFPLSHWRFFSCYGLIRVFSLFS